MTSRFIAAAKPVFSLILVTLAAGVWMWGRGSFLGLVPALFCLSLLIIAPRAKKAWHWRRRHVVFLLLLVAVVLVVALALQHWGPQSAAEERVWTDAVQHSVLRHPMLVVPVWAFYVFVIGCLWRVSSIAGREPSPSSPS